MHVPVRLSALSNRERELALTREMSVRLWRYALRNTKRACGPLALRPGSRGAHRRGLVCASGDLLYSASWDKTARVWQAGACLRTLKGHEAAVWSVLPLGRPGGDAAVVTRWTAWCGDGGTEAYTEPSRHPHGRPSSGPSSL